MGAKLELDDFLWGVATAAYQIEGAYVTDGRLPSIWDTFSHTPGKVKNGDTGDIATDSYHRFDEDIELIKAMGVDSYRFSISWSRVMPTGRLPLNPKGVEYYNRVIDTLLKNNITPFITLYHWDMPQALEDEFGGWLDEKSVQLFKVYAEACFLQFGDRVKHWITFNEPLTFVNVGYLYGRHAPGRCSDRFICDEGNSGREPYIVAHNVLLAHAEAVESYRSLTMMSPNILNGEIGITLNCDWAEPMRPGNEDDIAAAQRYLEFQMAWFADPVFFGDYPKSMKDRVGERLPTFTEEQSNKLKGSWDFYGFNHYTSVYASEPKEPIRGDAETDGGFLDYQVLVSQTSLDGEPIGEKAEPSWLYMVPWGFEKILEWISKRYKNPPIFITENGCAAPGESELSMEEALKDDFRVRYYDGYLNSMFSAMRNGVDVKGYFAWSLLDNFEWAEGYEQRFGMHYVDFKNGLKRYPKDSSKFYSKFLQESKAKYSNMDVAEVREKIKNKNGNSEIRSTNSASSNSEIEKEEDMNSRMIILMSVGAFVCGILSVLLFLTVRQTVKSRKQPDSRKKTSEKHTSFVLNDKDHGAKMSKNNLAKMRSPNGSRNFNTITKSTSGNVLHRTLSRAKSPPSKGDIALAVLSHRESSDYTGNEPLNHNSNEDFGHYHDDDADPDFDRL